MIALGLTLAALSGAEIAPAAGHGAAAPKERPSLSAELRGLVRMAGGPPGAIVVVQRGARSAVFRAGAGDPGSGKRIGVEDYMRVASTSKAFSGAVALALVNCHVLSLKDTIRRLLPDLPRAWRRVTLGQALQHTSGLPDFTESKEFLAYLVKHLHAKPSPRFLLRFVARHRLRFQPGTAYRYSNTDNVVVGLMAQAATQRSYNQLLRKYVYSRIGLRRTSLPRGAAIPAPFIHGYSISPGAPPDDVSTVASAAYFWASGGIVSTPRELNRFARAYVGARLFSRHTQRAQFRFVAGQSDPFGPGASSAGLGIFRYRTRCGTVYGHTGSLPGYTQFMAATRDGTRSVTVSIGEQLSQRDTGKVGAAFRRLRAIEVDAVCRALS